MSDVVTNESSDWVDDEALSFDEAMARFEALEPVDAVGLVLPGGAAVVTAFPTTGGSTVIASGLTVSVGVPRVSRPVAV